MATVPSLATQSAGGVATAAWANSVQSGFTFYNAPPRASLRQTGAQSLTNNTWTALNFDTEDTDNDGAHSTSSNTSRFTAQTAGYYLVSGQVCIAANSTGQRGARLGINGTVQPATQVQGNTGSAGAWDGPTQTRLLFLNVGDYVEVFGFQNSGGSLNTQVTSPEQSGMTVLWIGS